MLRTLLMVGFLVLAMIAPVWERPGPSPQPAPSPRPLRVEIDPAPAGAP